MADAKGDFEIDAQVQMHEMRLLGLFCDAAIWIPEEEVKLPVHRNVMASCSHYFRSLFTSGLMESDQNEVTIRGVSAKTMDQIIRYAYLRHAFITAENVEDLIAAADRFHIFGLQKECASYLLENLVPENCIGILKFAKFYNFEILTNHALKFILSNFTEVADQSQEFVQLELQDLLDILKNDELYVKNESDVFLAIQRWVSYDHPNRKFCYQRLVKVLRLAFMNRDFFQRNIEQNNELLNQNCSKIIQKAATLMEITNPITKLIDSKDIMLRPRVPSEVIFTVGGWSSCGTVGTVETYDVNVNQWFTVTPPMVSPRAYHGTVSLNGAIYTIGGFDGNRYLNNVNYFDPVKRTWEERAPMYMARCYVSTVIVDGFIYACGGFDGRQRHNTVERYDAIHNQWTHVQPMWRNRSDAGSSTLEGKIYIAGGFDGQACLDSMETYDPKTNQWTMLPAMTTRRSGVALVTHESEIVALGGYDGFNRLTTVEKFNPRKNTWTFLPNMGLGRSNFAATVMADKIFAIGGYDGATTSSDVESYNSKTKTWHRVCNLTVGRSAVTSCVISNLSNARDFTFHGNNSQKP